MNNWRRQLIIKQLQGSHLEASNMDNESYSKCLNCGTCYKGNFCPNCGQSRKTKRFTIASVFGQFLEILTNMERGALHTCIDLCYRPGYMIRDYLKGHRVEYTKPIQLLFILATISLVLHLLLYQSLNLSPRELSSDMSIDGEMSKRIVDIMYKVFVWIDNNQAITYLLMVSFLVLPNMLCFRWTRFGRNMNLAEHFFAMVYVGCQLLMLHIVAMPFNRLLSSNPDDGLSFGLPFLIIIWDFHQLMHIGYLRSLKLTCISFILALILFIILVVALVTPFYYLFIE